MARNFVADVGENSAAQSGGLLELARRDPKNGERDCERLMSKKLGLTIPIETHFLQTEDDSLRIPFLRFRDWMAFLIQHNCLHILCGLVNPHPQREGDIWECFWRHFEKLHPQHPIFGRARRGELQLRNCVALLCHGDEGRSKKRSPFLVLNVHSPLGRGIGPGLREGCKRKYLKLLPNFHGHSYTNRFLVSAIAKSGYTGKNSWVFDLLLTTLSEELVHMANVGVQVGRQRRWAFCIGIVGDWPWLAKCGLERSFMNVPKHKASGDGQPRECRGICHLCQAGQSRWPYEQIATKHPLWEATVLQQSPFVGGSNPFETLPHVEGELPKLFCFDLFHCWHLGVCKNYLGSMLSLLSALEPGTTIDLRFEQMTSRYLAWCKQSRRQPHCKRITKDHISWNAGYPTGTWHKGDYSTSLALWVEARFHTEDWSNQDPMLQKAGEAIEAANKCLSILYKSEAWMPPNIGLEAAEYGLRFLRRYSQLATDAIQRNLRHWLIMPKCHALHHLLLEVYHASAAGHMAFNPMCCSVQQDEDFIGRNSRLSRHVSTARTEERVVSRYLRATYSAYIEAGYLVRASEV